MSLITALENRFGAHRIQTIQNPLHPEQTLYQLYLEMQVPITVVMTSSLSTYEMPVSEKWKGREFNELFVCLPSYWDLEDLNNPNFNWVYEWLYKLEQFVLDKQSWFGPGHTIPCGNPPVAISTLLQQEYFIFIDPIFLQEGLKPLQTDGKTIHFLAVVPIFGDELDYKMGKGTHKFVRRFIQRKNDERIDDFRKSVLSSRLRFF